MNAQDKTIAVSDLVQHPANTHTCVTRTVFFIQFWPYDLFKNSESNEPFISLMLSVTTCVYIQWKEEVQQRLNIVPDQGSFCKEGVLEVMSKKLENWLKRVKTY